MNQPLTVFLDRPCEEWSLQESHGEHKFFHSDGWASCPGWSQPTTNRWDKAVAEDRRAIHELLVTLPAWDADAVRDALTRFEQIHRDHVLTEAAELLRDRNPDRCWDFSEGVDWAAAELLAARTNRETR